MKIPSCLKPPAIFVITAIPIGLIGNRCSHAVVNDIKNEVLLKDSLRYKRVENETKNYDYIVQKKIWTIELSNMNDSLRVDSIAKRAYFEGAQMVRDSINNSRK